MNENADGSGTPAGRAITLSGTPDDTFDNVEVFDIRNELKAAYDLLINASTNASNILLRLEAFRHEIDTLAALDLGFTTDLIAAARAVYAAADGARGDGAAPAHQAMLDAMTDALRLAFTTADTAAEAIIDGYEVRWGTVANGVFTAGNKGDAGVGAWLVFVGNNAGDYETAPTKDGVKMAAELVLRSTVKKAKAGFTGVKTLQADGLNDGVQDGNNDETYALFGGDVTPAIVEARFDQTVAAGTHQHIATQFVFAEGVAGTGVVVATNERAGFDVTYEPGATVDQIVDALAANQNFRVGFGAPGADFSNPAVLNRFKQDIKTWFTTAGAFVNADEPNNVDDIKAELQVGGGTIYDTSGNLGEIRFGPATISLIDASDNTRKAVSIFVVKESGIWVVRGAFTEIAGLQAVVEAQYGAGTKYFALGSIAADTDTFTSSPGGQTVPANAPEELEFKDASSLKYTVPIKNLDDNVPEFERPASGPELSSLDARPVSPGSYAVTIDGREWTLVIADFAADDAAAVVAIGDVDTAAERTITVTLAGNLNTVQHLRTALEAFATDISARGGPRSNADLDTFLIEALEAAGLAWYVPAVAQEPADPAARPTPIATVADAPLEVRQTVKAAITDVAADLPNKIAINGHVIQIVVGNAPAIAAAVDSDRTPGTDEGFTTTVVTVTAGTTLDQLVTQILANGDATGLREKLGFALGDDVALKKAILKAAQVVHRTDPTAEGASPTVAEVATEGGTDGRISTGIVIQGAGDKDGETVGYRLSVPSGQNDNDLVELVTIDGRLTIVFKQGEVPDYESVRNGRDKGQYVFEVESFTKSGLSDDPADRSSRAGEQVAIQTYEMRFRDTDEAPWDIGFEPTEFGVTPRRIAGIQDSDVNGGILGTIHFKNDAGIHRKMAMPMTGSRFGLQRSHLTAGM